MGMRLYCWWVFVQFWCSLNSLYKFVPATNTWSTLAPFPGPGAIMTSAVYYPTTNKLYVFGGEDAVSAQNYNDDAHL